MKRRLSFIVIFCAASLFCFAGCGSPATGSGKYSLTPVSVPDDLRDNDQRKEYIVNHYWDTFAFADTTQIAYDSLIRRDYASYAVMFKLTDEATARGSVRNLIRATAADSSGAMTAYFLNVTEDFLYDTLSEFRNEELYIEALEEAFALGSLSHAALDRAQRQHHRLQWNRVGSTASDLPIVHMEGVRRSLHEIDTDYTLICFYKPDCQKCSFDMGMTDGHTEIRRLASQGRITLIGYDLQDREQTWRVYPNGVPRGWINSPKPARVSLDSLRWDIRMTPSIYLLDRDKTVMLKDARYGDLSSWLHGRSL